MGNHPLFLFMRAKTASSRNFFQALGVSVVLHAILLAAPIRPVAGNKLPAGTRLDGRLVKPVQEVATESKVKAEDSRLPESQNEKPDVGHPAPSGAIESAIAAPYLSSTEVDVRADPISLPPLILPEFIVRRHAKGKVALLVFISAKGDVDAVEVLSSTHPGELEEAAIEVTKATRFSPAMRAGQAVKNAKRIEVIFDPDEPAAP